MTKDQLKKLRYTHYNGKKNYLYSLRAKNFVGQIGLPLMSNLSKYQMVADPLHTILNMHQPLWYIMMNYVFDFNRQDRLIAALKSIGLHSVVIKVRSFMLTKKKLQQNIGDIKFKGPVCLIMELGIVRFCSVLVGDDDLSANELDAMKGR